MAGSFKKIIFSFVIAVFLMLPLAPVLAESDQVNTGQTDQPVTNLLQGIDCIKTGNCSPEDILQVVVNVMNLILGVVGSLMLFMFVYGAVIMITSAGKAEAVEKGKKTLLNAVIGGILVLGAWFLVNSIVSRLVKSDFKKKEEIRLQTEELIKESPEK